MDKTKRSALRKRKDYTIAAGMIAPAFILSTIFVVIPLILAIYRSFFHYRVYSEIQEFVGFRNYINILQNEFFTKSFLNVFLLTALIVVLIVVSSFLVANLLKSVNRKLTNVSKTIIYIPALISGMAASIIFLYLMSYSGGLFNNVLLAFGKEPIAYATEGIWPYISIVLPSWWLAFGANCIIFLAGILNIPESYYEAASIDGANASHKLWYITLPNMKNFFVLILVNLIAGNLQMFELPLMMTGGGPDMATYTPVLFVYNLYRAMDPKS